METCIFCNIANGKSPATFIFQDDDVMVFKNLYPMAPVHLLIVPKKHVPEFVALEDSELRSKLFHTVHKMIKEQHLEGKKYRIVINGGGAQEIDHLHIHLLSPIRTDAGMA